MYSVFDIKKQEIIYILEAFIFKGRTVISLPVIDFSRE